MIKKGIWGTVHNSHDDDLMIKIEPSSADRPNRIAQRRQVAHAASLNPLTSQDNSSRCDVIYVADVAVSRRAALLALMRNWGSKAPEWAAFVALCGEPRPQTRESGSIRVLVRRNGGVWAPHPKSSPLSSRDTNEWRWRESNPRPRVTNQVFSGRSWLGVLSAPALAPARCRQAQSQFMSLLSPETTLSR